eukprot:13540171-Alexandrium_andersonii.AAC.1
MCIRDRLHLANQASGVELTRSLSSSGRAALKALSMHLLSAARASAVGGGYCQRCLRPAWVQERPEAGAL